MENQVFQESLWSLYSRLFGGFQGCSLGPSEVNLEHSSIIRVSGGGAKCRGSAPPKFLAKAIALKTKGGMRLELRM